MISIIDYGIGNLGSVANALDKLKISFQISSNPYVLKKSKGLILPGVGSAKQGMENLKRRKLDKIIVEESKKGKPILGICLGMQLLFEKSEEGNVSCLKILKGEVKKFQIERKVPQIGWNQVTIKQLNNEAMKQLMINIPDKCYFYFVNSFYCVPSDKSIILGKTIYGEKFASIVAKDNIVATQFHPEKSGKIGYQFLNNVFRYFNNSNYRSQLI